MMSRAKRALHGTGSAAAVAILGIAFASITIILATVYVYYWLMSVVIATMNGGE